MVTRIQAIPVPNNVIVTPMTPTVRGIRTCVRGAAETLAAEKRFRSRRGQENDCIRAGDCFYGREDGSTMDCTRYA